MSQEPIVVFHPDKTTLFLSADDRDNAVSAAFWLTASPHEWTWSQDDQIRMARYVLWAHQRLSAIEQLVSDDMRKCHKPSQYWNNNPCPLDT